MKKIFAVLTLMIYFLSSNMSYAGELYYLKNAQKATMQSSFQSQLKLEDYTIKTSNPVYAVSTKDNKKYLIAVFQQSGKNLFYYYSTNSNDKKYNKSFLKYLKSKNITYQQSFDESLLKNFEDIAQNTVNGVVVQYNFETPQYSNRPQTNTSQQSSSVLSGYIGMVGKGMTLNAYLQNPINTSTAQSGDIINAVLKTDWIVNNVVIAEQGSVISGYVIEANPASIGMRNGKVVMRFNQINTPSGRIFNIESQKIDFNVSNDGIVSKTVTKTLAATATGALLGLAIGALSQDYGKGAAIGAGVGASAMLISSGLSKGVDAEIPAYTDLDIVLDKDVKVIFKN